MYLTCPLSVQHLSNRLHLQYYRQQQVLCHRPLWPRLVPVLLQAQVLWQLFRNEATEKHRKHQCDANKNMLEPSQRYNALLLGNRMVFSLPGVAIY
jgi:hypothetical protein